MFTSQLDRYVFALPPLCEQDRIVSKIDELLTAADSTHAAIEQNSSRLRGLRQCILKWAFEGRLVDQDPSDESASALLERIRAEREGSTVKRSGSGPRKRREANA